MPYTSYVLADVFQSLMLDRTALGMPHTNGLCELAFWPKDLPVCFPEVLFSVDSEISNFLRRKRPVTRFRNAQVPATNRKPVIGAESGRGRGMPDQRDPQPYGMEHAKRACGLVELPPLPYPEPK